MKYYFFVRTNIHRQRGFVSLCRATLSEGQLRTNMWLLYMPKTLMTAEKSSTNGFWKEYMNFNEENGEKQQ